MAYTNPVPKTDQKGDYVYAIFSMFCTELCLQQRHVLQQGRYPGGRRGSQKMSGDLLRELPGEEGGQREKLRGNPQPGDLRGLQSLPLYL